MPTVQQGARGTIDLLQDLVVQEMMKKVAVLETTARPLTTLLNKLEKAYPTDTAEPQHTEDELLPNIDLVNGAHTAVDVTIAVDNPTFYLVGDIIHVPRTGENMRVTIAAGTSPVTVTRQNGVSAPAAAMLDDEVIWILGGSLEEGATSRAALNTLEVPYTAYCQIVRNSLEGTGTQMATRQLGGDFQDQFEKKLIEHKRQLEYFFKFGRRDRQTVNGEHMRTMGGFNERVRTNRYAVDGVMGEGEFEAVLEMASEFGSYRKIGLGGSRVLRSISNIARNRLVTVPGDESYGLALRRYEHQGGVIDFCLDREMKGETYGGHLWIVDIDYCMMRYLRAGSKSGKTSKYQGSLYCKRIEHIQANDADRRKDEIFSEITPQFIQERTQTIATGIQG